MRILILLAVLALIPNVFALQEPKATFIPQNISANSSFILIADPGDSEPVWVGWQTDVYVENYFGQVPKVGEKFVCYFSNVDANASCGIVPFPYSGNYKLFLIAKSPSDYKNSTIDVSIGGIQLTPTVNVDKNTVYMIVYPTSTVLGVKYEVYDSNLNLVKSGSLAYPPPYTAYVGNVTLNPGLYYIAFTANSQNDFGGTLQKVEIKGEAKPGVPTNLIKAPAVEQLVLTRKGQPIVLQNCSIVNLVDRTFENLSAEFPAGLQSFMQMDFNGSLEPNGTVCWTLTVTADSAMDINTEAVIKSGNETIGSMPIRLKISLIEAVQECPECPPCPTGGSISLDPKSWYGDFLMGKQSKEFTITSNANNSISLSYNIPDSLQDVLEVKNFPESLNPGERASFSINASPDSPGSYSGIITISSDVGQQQIAISLNFYPDISSELQSLKSDLEDIKSGLSPAMLNALSDIIDSVESSLDSAENYFDSQYYAEAQKKYEEAKAKLDILTSIATTGLPAQPAAGPDFGLVIIVIVVIAAAAGAGFFIFKKMRGKSLEEELEEEF